jgi:hypothetical protein
LFKAAVFFKGNINLKIIHRQIVPHYMYNICFAKKYGLTKKQILVSSVIDTADQKIGDFKVENFGEFESICKKVLTRISGAQMELFQEKKTEVKHLVTQSL